MTSRSVRPMFPVRRQLLVPSSETESSRRKARSVFPSLWKLSKETGSRKRSEREPSTLANHPNRPSPPPAAAEAEPVLNCAPPSVTSPLTPFVPRPERVVRLMTPFAFSPYSAGMPPVTISIPSATPGLSEFENVIPIWSPIGCPSIDEELLRMAALEVVSAVLVLREAGRRRHDRLERAPRHRGGRPADEGLVDVDVGHGRVALERDGLALGFDMRGRRRRRRGSSAMSFTTGRPRARRRPRERDAKPWSSTVRW